MSRNYIEAFHAYKFRQFEKIDIKFNKGFNFIAGPNGCGKTSILAGISHCFTQSYLNYSRLERFSEFWSDIVFGDDSNKYRLGFGPEAFDFQGYRKAVLRMWRSPLAHTDNTINLTINDAGKQGLNFFPLVIGAKRSINYKEITGMSRENNRINRSNEYLNSSISSLYGEKDYQVKQWLINRYFIIEKEWASEEKENWNHLIEKLKIISPFNSEFSFVKIERDLEPIFSIYGKECYLEELSAGFQSILSIIASIFEWIEATNKEGERLAIHATGTVLIDEIDLHLHPEWQFNLRDGLEAIFPNIQFIVTTHSPHILASAKPYEVIIIPKNNDGIYDLSPSSHSYSGWNTDQILEDLMGVVSLDNKTYEKLISEAFLLIDKNDIEGLRAKIGEITAITHPSDTIATVLRTRLAGMVALDD